MKNYNPISMLGVPSRMEYGCFNVSDNIKSRSEKITPQELKRRLKKDILSPYRDLVQPDHGAGVQISFEEFLSKRPDGGTVFVDEAGNPLKWQTIFEAQGLDPSRVLFNEIAALSSDFRLLLSAIVNDSFVKGFSTASNGQPPLWSQLCYRTGVPCALDEFRRTWLKFNGQPQITAEAETFPEATITLGTEIARMQKKGITLRMSEEFVRANPIDVVAEWLIYLGRRHQLMEDDAAVLTLVNGDLSTGSNAAPVVGVADTATGVDYVDFLKCWTRGSVIGENFYSLIANETMSHKIALIDEFKERRQGKSQITIVNRPEPATIDRFVNNSVPANQIVLLDRSHAMKQRVFQPVRIDRSFKPESWENGITIGYISAFEKVGDKATIIIDESLSFSEHPFPNWLTIDGVRP
jgi:hypothetical protein